MHKDNINQPKLGILIIGLVPHAGDDIILKASL